MTGREALDMIQPSVTLVSGPGRDQGTQAAISSIIHLVQFAFCCNQDTQMGLSLTQNVIYMHTYVYILYIYAHSQYMFCRIVYIQ